MTICHDIRYCLPNYAYYVFVARHLLHRDVGGPFVDPFAVDMPVEKLKEAATTQVVTTSSVSDVEFRSWRRQLEEARENLLIIAERQAEYVEEVNIPLQLVKEKRRCQSKITELEQKIKARSASRQMARMSEQLQEMYVVRETVEREVNQPGTLVILGQTGSGKTTLFEKLMRQLHSRTLMVGLPMTRVLVSVPEQALTNGKISLLTPEILTRYVFNAYWENFLMDPARRDKFLPHLRRDRSWMERLRWHYQHSQPWRPDLPGEFELMTWLQEKPACEPFSADLAPDYVLDQLIQLVTFVPPRQDFFGISDARPYERVQVMIDETAHLSSKAVGRLLQDVYKIRHLNLLQFKLFITSTYQKLVKDMAAVREGRVNVYRLPAWEDRDLREMLYLRLLGWMEGEPVGGDDNWAQQIPDEYLRREAKPTFIEQIVEGAQRCQAMESKLAAPIHALRIARGLVAACAGVWESHPPPLGRDDIKQLINLYWHTEQEEKDADISKSPA